MDNQQAMENNSLNNLENNSLQKVASQIRLRNPNSNLSLRDTVKDSLVRESKNLLLLDISGSMSEHVQEQQRRIDILWNIVQDLISQNISFRIMQFNNFPNWVSNLTNCPFPSGGTNLASALTLASEAKPENITIITDGEPDSQHVVFKVAASLRCKINVLFCGNDNSTLAKQFCYDLAELCNGKYYENPLNTDLKMLSASKEIRGMLTEGKPLAISL